jgi:hypothetical protein
MAEHGKVLEACRAVLAAARLWESRWRFAKSEDAWKAALEAASIAKLLYQGTCLNEPPGDEESIFEHQGRVSALAVFRAVTEPLGSADGPPDAERWRKTTREQKLAFHHHLFNANDALAAACDLLELAAPLGNSVRNARILELKRTTDLKAKQIAAQLESEGLGKTTSDNVRQVLSRARR